MRRLTSVLVAVVALSAIAAPAQGQFGNLRRKAKEKAQQAVTGQPAANTNALTFDDTMLELNAQVVARLIKGLDVRSRMKGPGGLTAAQLRERSQAAYDQASKINGEHVDERHEYNNKKGEADNCTSMQLQEISSQHVQELQRKIMGMTGVNTPEKMAFMQEYVEMSQEAAAAAQNPQDTAALRRVTERQNKLLGINPKADSAKARAACNVPVPPRWLALADSLQIQGDTLSNQARRAEGLAVEASARAAEMTPEQFAMALERAQAFVASTGQVGSQTIYLYSPVEREALTAQLSVLRRHLG
jgi:hypothetical protein